MKTIGLIGGMSWESTVTYYQIINEVVKNKLGGLHSAKCVLYSVDFEEIEECQKKEDILSIILDEIKKNPKISRKKIAEKVGVSVKTIERYIKEIQNLKFIGRGSNGYWKLEE